MPRKLILKSMLALGDIVCFTAAIRELHRQFPGQFLTDVRTPSAAVWEQNRHITPIADDDPEAETIEVHYDRDQYVSVNRSNEHPVHLIEGYCKDLANTLGLANGLRPLELCGHIELSPDEYCQMTIPHRAYNCQRYWIVCAGGKNDFTVKHWPVPYYQRVIDHFIGRIQFVQIGSREDGHIHHPLHGVIDLVGQTTVRELIHTVHAACGVLCGITGVMHLAAAVPTPVWQLRPRPCVVVAGGREPRSWYGYQNHRILETVGSLSCCATGGCWQSHTHPLRPDDRKPDDRLCHRVVNNTPKCMAIIRPESVILEIERILDGEGVQ